MPIIVSSFEIILSGENQPREAGGEPPRPPAPEAPEPPRAEPPAAPPPLRPEEIEFIMHRFARRRLRLRAD